MSASSTAASSLMLSGQLVGGEVGEREPGELGLDAVDEVAEDPAAAAAALAVAAPAGSSAHTPQAEMQEARTRSPGGQAADAAADLDDRADRLVAEDPAGLHVGHVAAENVQVGAADRDRVDLDDRVARVDDLRVRDVGPGLCCRAAVHQCFHYWISLSMRAGSTRVGSSYSCVEADPGSLL